MNPWIPLKLRFLIPVRTFLVVIVTSLIVVAIPTPNTAHAAGGCSVGYSCAWTGKSYSATSWGNRFDYGSWHRPQLNPPYGIDNKARSVHANGRYCMATRYYTGKNQSGSSFWIRSESAGYGNYRDPNLANSAGNRPGVNFDKVLTSYTFISC